jgi:hypothetical protein
MRTQTENAALELGGSVHEITYKPDSQWSREGARDRAVDDSA